MITRKNSILLIAVFLFLLSACKQGVLYTNNVDFENHTWHKDSVLQFNYNITDTNQVCNIFVNNRVSGEYQFSNLYLFIDTWLPDSTHMRDTLECILADQSGKWLGKGFGSTWSTKVYYRRLITFPMSGSYTMKIQQAMREENLTHILDAGISIEKAKIKR